MKHYSIVTDSCSDIPLSYAIVNQIEVVSLHFMMGGNVYQDDLGQTMSYEDFFKKIDEGEMPTTSQPTPDSFYQIFKKGVEQGNDILYIGVSSELSGTYNSANIAKEMVLEENPEANIVCFSTLNGSMGQTLFIKKAVEMKNEGKSINQVLDVLNQKLSTQRNLIMVNNLEYLRRGGRISGIQSAIGTMLKMNPILQLDKEGKIQAIDKVRGRKKAIRTLIDYVVNNIQSPISQTVSICHANVIDDAETIKEEIMKAVAVKEVIVNSIGPVVGSHSGSGAIGVFFLN